MPVSENLAEIASGWSPTTSNVLSSTSTTPSPTPLFPSPFQAVPARASPDSDGESRTLEGPSASEWVRHRDTIIGLYKQHPLERVSEFMKRCYGFSASKRMYDKRFREWNVFKNVNGNDRARATSRAQGAPSAAGHGDGINRFNQEGLHRTIRGTRTIQQGVRKGPPSNPPRNDPTY
ncbi:hypothetical protein VTI74DRAFT_8929 [Chaetomium olivicolor]